MDPERPASAQGTERKRTSPPGTYDLTEADEERLWAKVSVPKDVMTGCWLWTAGTNGVGYGRLRLNGRMVYAHRLSYELVKGPIPAGLDLDHLCRNRGCCNPGHLEAVSRRENCRRGLLMGHTWNSGRGERSGNAKLTDAQVQAIRADSRLQRVIAAEYGISRATVCGIKLRRSWSWLP